MDEHVSDDVGAAPVVVRVSGLCQGYGGTTVLRNINIDVHGGRDSCVDWTEWFG